MFALAGVWRQSAGERLEVVEGKSRRQRVHKDDWQLYAFLTCEPNDLVAPIHPKAMSVILGPDDFENWLNAPWDEA